MGDNEKKQLEKMGA